MKVSSTNKKRPTFSLYSISIKTIDDLLKNTRIRKDFFRYLGISGYISKFDLKEGKVTKTSAIPMDDEVILLANDLNLIKIDWESTEKNKPNSQRVDFSYEHSKILPLIERVYGRTSFIDRRSVNLISNIIGYALDPTEFNTFLDYNNIPGELVDYDDRQYIEGNDTFNSEINCKVIYEILMYYTSSPHEIDHQMFFNILENFIHPLNFKGEQEQSQIYQQKIQNILQYDNYEVINGKFYKTTTKDKTNAYLFKEKPYINIREYIEIVKSFFRHFDNSSNNVISRYDFYPYLNEEIFQRTYYDIYEKHGHIETLQASLLEQDADENPTQKENLSDTSFVYKVKDISFIKKELNLLENKFPFRKQPIIRKKALSLICSKIISLKLEDEVQTIIKEMGIEPYLLFSDVDIDLRGLYSIFDYLIHLDKPEGKNNFFRILEEISHPLMFNTDKEQSQMFQNFLTSCLEHDGYKFYQGKIVSENSNLPKNAIKKADFIFKEESSTSIPVSSTPPIHVNIYNSPNSSLPHRASSVEKKDLSKSKIHFDDNKAVIYFDEESCILPPFKNEHFFCKVMFRYPPKEPIDWSTIYEKMESENKEVSNTKKDKRMIQDTMYAVNNRIKEVIHTDDELFAWKNKSITRKF